MAIHQEPKGGERGRAVQAPCSRRLPGRQDRLAAPAAAAGYQRARRAFELGQQLRALREAQHLSQAELARRMGSTQPAIARLEAGRVAPSLDTLDRAAAALGVELVITLQHPQRRGRRQLSG